MSDNEDMDNYDEDDYDYQEDDVDYQEIKTHNTFEYEMLKPDEFVRKRDEQIDEFVELSSLSRDEATIVLINYQWNFEKLQSVWFENVELNKIKCGIEISPQARKEINKFFEKNKIGENTCLTCFDEIKPGYGISLKCKHALCKECYTDYLLTRLEDPLTLIASPCPLLQCNLIIGESIFKKCFENNQKALDKYNKFLIKNYTESNSDIKWCPNPNCGICIRVPGHGMKEIKCQCGTIFCFRCLRETHRPCDCEMISLWEAKNKSQSEDAKWIIVNTKQCPNCHKYIEKNQGCNHMTCRKEAGGCGYEFCWICLGEWKKHGTSWYKCTFYDPNKVDKEKEKLKNDTKFELEKYISYFDKYINHDKSQKFAEKLNDKILGYKNRFQKEKNIPYLELAFLDEAVATVIDCHRMLKNTYIFGYYMIKCNEQKLYEHNQYILDQKSDQLHEMIEQEQFPDILKITNIEDFNSKFIKFKNDIINLISTIKNYREHLLDYIENKMIDLVDYKQISKDGKSVPKPNI